MKNLVLSMKEKPLSIFDSRGAVSLMEVNLIHLIAMYFRKSFKFYSNLSFKRNVNGAISSFLQADSY